MEVMTGDFGLEWKRKDGIAHKADYDVLIKAYENQEKINNILFQYAQIDGSHHKMWCLDQIARIIHDDKYEEFVKKYEYDEETGEEYEWDCGIAP